MKADILSIQSRHSVVGLRAGGKKTDEAGWQRMVDAVSVRVGALVCLNRFWQKLPKTTLELYVVLES